jgi:YegS/Rv2252/BmrU family lipid kinase
MRHPASPPGSAPAPVTPVSRSRTDAAFVALTRAADHSVLWMAAAGALALAGGQRGRQAAGRGLGAIALASAVTNGPLKLAFRRPRPERSRAVIRPPRSFSFFSGHSASAFAFATAAAAEQPASAPLLVPLAAAVAYSRVRAGVHRPADVLLGGAVGVASGLLVSSVGRLHRRVFEVTPASPPAQLPAEVVLVTSPHAGSSAGLDAALQEMRAMGLSVAEHLDIQHFDRLPELIRTADGGPRLVVAAGGDGTVGAVADCLAETGSVLGILPLGTSNDFARSLGIPIDPRAAAALLTRGKVADVDLGRLMAPGQPARHFVHAATVGLNVNFARLATRASLRARLGRLTYLAAASHALRARPAFECELRHGGHTEQLSLTQLSVINAPVFGGALGLSVEGSNPDDRLLDVLAVENVPVRRMLLAAVFLVLRIKRPMAGVRALHIRSLHVHTEHPLEVALDGEITGRLRGEFKVPGEALRVITPIEFEDIND